MQRQFWVTLILLALILLVFQRYDIDAFVQNYFYAPSASNASPHWLVSEENRPLEFVFHELLKVPIYLVGIVSLLALAASFFTARLVVLRPRLMVVLLSVIVVPLCISVAKHMTNIYCPSQLAMYGGLYPHVMTFDAYPADFIQVKHGKCYPAAHASAGFALMSLCFLFATRRRQILAWLSGMTLGWIMGVYQMLKGAHFLSHTLVTMCCSWLLILLCYAVVNQIYRGRLCAKSSHRE